MSIESLKRKARTAEQNESWSKALELYKKALSRLESDDQVDIGLHNRVGDLHVRVGQLDQAIEHYQKAVALYREAYLPNNAIAVCKKILRSVPDHHGAYLVIGQIRAEQGFIPDARTNFLTYAERMQQEGELDESFRALVEFCDLAPDDVGVRLTVAEQMASHGREGDAVEQLLLVRRHYQARGASDEAAGIEEKILTLDPEADFSAADVQPDAPGDDASGDDEVEGDEPDSLVSDALEDAAARARRTWEEARREEARSMPGDAPSTAGESAEERPPTDAEEEAAEPAQEVGFEPSSRDLDADAGGEGVTELPLFGFRDELEDDGEPEEEPSELPMIDFSEDEAATAPTEGSLPQPDAEGRAQEDDEAAERATFGPSEETEEAIEPPPFGGADDDPGAGSTPSREDVDQGSQAPARPPGRGGGGSHGFVDLGEMILGGDREKTTRFTVAYQEPTGDEDADFSEMLTQFKDKVSENLDSGDVRAHHDLGMAYKEMGLLDEAIASFQAALRASAEHLPTYELMGQTFIEMGRPEAAVRSLERALRSASAVEDELVGIYYYLGRAHEALENMSSAVDYYDRVFSLDINFADVTERLRELR